MNELTVLVVATAVGVTGVWFVVDGTGRRRPSLAAATRSLRTGNNSAADRSNALGAEGRDRLLIDRVGAAFVDTTRMRWSTSTRSALRLIDRSPTRHAGLLVAAGLIGLIAPAMLATAAARFAPVDDSRVVEAAVPAILGLVGVIGAPLLVHVAAAERAGNARIDLRHQLSAFVDVVTMLLAGNTGHEGALRQAAEAGDGRLFRELRRRMREVAATGRSLVDALDLVAHDLALPEVARIASTSRLAATEGAPVAASLAATCRSLRSTLAADEEAAARVRTDKVTPPLVGMTLLFMAVIIFPALDL